MTLHLHTATAADLDDAARLFDLYRQFYEQPADRALARGFLAERLARAESVLLLARDEQGQAVGLCQLYPSFCSVEARPIYVLYDLFVDPAARRAGVARALLQAAEDRAVADGKARLDLTTAHTNTAAQALYRSMGWRRDEVYQTFNRWPGQA